MHTADYVVEELYGSTGHTDANRGQLSRYAELYDSEDSDGYSAHGQDDDAESEDDGDYVDAGFTSDRGDLVRTPRNSAKSFRGPTEGRDCRDTSCESDGKRESEESDEDDSAMVSVAATRRYDNATPRPRVVKLLRANVSAVSSTLARKLRASRDQQIDIQGIGKDKVSTTHKALVKVTLGWEVVYEFEEFRLDLYNSAAKLPDEVVVPLLRSKASDDQTYGLQTADGPTEAVCLSDRATAEFKLRRKQPSERTHEFWLRRTEDWIPTIVMNAKAHFPVVIWLPHGKLPPEGYVRLNSATYRDWQVLAYESAIDKDLLYKEQELYAVWLSRQPPAVERKPYHWPKGVKERPPEANKGKQLTEYRTQQGVVEEERDAEIRLTQLDTPEADLESQTDSANEANEDSDELEATNDAIAADPEEDLRLRFLAAAASASDDELVAESDYRFTHFEGKGETLHLEDYAHELAFLSGLSEEVPIELDYNGVNAKCSAHNLSKLLGWKSY
ncbi:Hypothetical protein PHPALM_6564 [Phytophthora palmivora]|uniref:Uncharacterized protein n=1 Tax=Phytophthora palmivora TaxID=4796 RepID=A0A2P4YEH9_9STRA|nr:Hypothetical protein PHPALM_6564 [Phytophthora palmivora]